MVAGRRAHGWEEATVLGVVDPADTGMGRPHDGSRAHGGLRWYRAVLPDETRYHLIGYSLGGVALFEAAGALLFGEPDRWRGRIGSIITLAAPLFGTDLGLEGDLPPRAWYLTHCVNGHEYTDANTAHDTSGRRYCVTCRHQRPTHCSRGHPYDEANTFRDRHGYRHCRACNRDRARAHYYATR